MSKALYTLGSLINQALEDYRSLGQTTSEYHHIAGGVEGGYYPDSQVILRDRLVEWSILKDKSEGIEPMSDGIGNLLRRYRHEGVMEKLQLHRLEELLRSLKPVNPNEETTDGSN